MFDEIEDDSTAIREITGQSLVCRHPWHRTHGLAMPNGQPAMISVEVGQSWDALLALAQAQGWQYSDVYGWLCPACAERKHP